MSQAGRERDQGEGASLEAMVDVVGYLRAELQTIREREQRREGRTTAFGPDTPPPPGSLDPPVQAQLDRLESTLTEGLAWIPERADQFAEREELARLADQLDGLRTSMTDRFDALQPPDLRPLLEHLDRIHQQIASLPVPDLHPVRERIEGLHHEIQALAPPDLEPVRARLDQLQQQIAGLPRADQVVGALAPQLEAVRDALRPDGVLEAIDAMASTLRAQVSGVGELGPQVRLVLEPLAARLDRLVESDSTVRDDLVLATEVLVGLTQLTEATEQHLNELVSGQEAALLAQRDLVASSFGDLSRTLAEQAQGVENQLGALVARMTAIEDNVSAHLHTAVARIEEGLATHLQEQLGELGLEQLHASVAEVAQRIREARADDRTVLEAVLAIDGQIKELDLGPLAATVAGLGQQVAAGRADGSMLIEAVRAVETGFDGLDPTSLAAAVADLGQLVAAGRDHDQMVAAAMHALDARIGELDASRLTPLRSDVDGLRAQLEAIPAPDLSRVESALTRITAAVLSESRREAATTEDLQALGQSVEEAMEAMALLVDHQAQETTAMAAQVAAMGHPGDSTDSTDSTPTDPGVQDTLERVLAELAATRQAVERRSGSRWRRRGEDEMAPPIEVAPPVKPEPLLPAGPTAVEQRLEVALAEMDQRLADLTRQVQRTADHAVKAASAATAALEGVTAATAGAAKGPARRTASTASAKAAEKTTAKSTATKKTPAKKTTAQSTPAKKTPAKSATAKKTPAKKTPAKKTPTTRAGGALQAPVRATVPPPPPPPPPG